jgi:hypothetical protein
VQAIAAAVAAKAEAEELLEVAVAAGAVERIE